MKRVRISSMLDARETCTPQHLKLQLVGTRQATAGNSSLTLIRFFHGALIKNRKTDAFLSKRCGGVGQGQSLVHAQITHRSLPAKASTACFDASPVHVAHAGARVGMHQHGETTGMTSPRQSIVQPQPTTINALLGSDAAHVVQCQCNTREPLSSIGSS